MFELMKMKNDRTELKLDLVRAFRENRKADMEKIFNDIKALDKTISTLENIGATINPTQGFTCGA